MEKTNVSLLEPVNDSAISAAVKEPAPAVRENPKPTKEEPKSAKEENAPKKQNEPVQTDSSPP